jgi:ABC-type multidrug transport system fused ATPase/permease subunit
MIKNYTICFLVIFFVVGCFSGGKTDRLKTNPPPPKPVSPEIKQVTSSTEKSNEQMGSSIEKIELEAKQIEEKTPEDYKPIILPHVSNIYVQTKTQWEILTAWKEATESLKTLSNKVKESEDYADQLFKSNEEAIKKNQDLADKITSLESESQEMLKKNFATIIMISFFSMVISIAITVMTKGNRYAMYSAVSCGIALLLAIFLMQTIAWIHWVVFGLIIIAAALFVKDYYDRIKANKELVKTTESLKSYTSTEARKEFFGDGPVPGKVQMLQSPSTVKIVEDIRKEITNAPSVQPSDFIDLNNDGIDDRVENQASVQTTPLKKKKSSPVRGKITLK